MPNIRTDPAQPRPWAQAEPGLLNSANERLLIRTSATTAVDRFVAPPQCNYALVSSPLGCSVDLASADRRCVAAAADLIPPIKLTLRTCY